MLKNLMGVCFLNPELKHKCDVEVAVPSVNKERCILCGDCARACQFNSIAVTKNKLVFFPQLCHHCGACFISCKENALIQKKRTIGIIEGSNNNSFIQGKLNIGEPISIPIIKELKKYIDNKKTVIIDCSPGASCNVVLSIEDCDFCILVTEPTPFGLHDLKIGVSLLKKLKLPFGIIINKAFENNSIIKDFCEKEKIEVLMEIPYSKETAGKYSRG
jgi:MinD superfamily P-loop ATPase